MAKTIPLDGRLACPPEVLDDAILIDGYDGVTWQLEIAIQTKGRVPEDRIAPIRDWAIAAHQRDAVKLVNLLAPFCRPDTMGIWLAVGFYHDDQTAE